MTALPSRPPSPAPFIQLTGSPRGLFCPGAHRWLLYNAPQTVTSLPVLSQCAFIALVILFRNPEIPLPRKGNQHQLSLGLCPQALCPVSPHFPLPTQCSFSSVCWDAEMRDDQRGVLVHERLCSQCSVPDLGATRIPGPELGACGLGCSGFLCGKTTCPRSLSASRVLTQSSRLWPTAWSPSYFERLT